MDYPATLTPTQTISFTTSLGPSTIPRAIPVFRPWIKASPGDSYGHKAFLDYRGSPMFAELVILAIFRDAGWDGVWVDSFRRRFWSGFQVSSKSLPEYPASIVRCIHGSGGFPRGCWDVICWREREIVFAEAKRGGHDCIRPTQIRWLSNALDRGGLSPENFLVVEWSVNQPSP